MSCRAPFLPALQAILRTFAPALAVTAATAIPSFAEEGVRRVSAFDVMAGDMEPSTVALRETSIHFPGSHLRPDSAAYSVEARIAPSFVLLRAVPDWPGGAFMLATTPKVVLRRSDGLGSNPVRTPGYMPSATLFYSPRDTVATRGIGAKDATPMNHGYLSFAVMHHSNGQEGPFLTGDGRPNNVNGSFSLWSMALTAHLRNAWPLLPEYKAVRLERFYFKEGLLDNLYPDWAASLVLRTAHHRLGPIPGYGRLLADFDWKPRKESAFPSALKPAPFSAALTAAYAPMSVGSKVFMDFAVFARFYAGSDDYNMNFDREVYRLEFGLMLGPGGLTSGAWSP